MSAINQISGSAGNDILATGTYKISDGTLKKKIFAVETAGEDSQISLVKIDSGNGGLKQLGASDFAWLSTGNLTADMGFMTFGNPVEEITIGIAACKVWFVI